MDLPECYECEREIAPNELYWSVNLHRESFEDGIIRVQQATAVAVFCEACAGKRDLDQIYVPLKQGRNGS